MLPADIQLPPTLSPTIVLVQPDAKHAYIHQQLISADKSDKVHPVGDLKDLLRYRLGYPGDSKLCFALMQGTEVQAAIYTYWSCPEDAESEWMKLPGQVDKILKEPSHHLPEMPGIVTFYSISSFVNGGGKTLINELHRAFTTHANPPILTTLSPLRSLRAWIEETGREIEDTIDSLVDAAAEYLGLKKDPVQRFHQGNGAYIGAIQPFANAAGTKDDEDGLGLMVNYRYPRSAEALQANQADYRAGAIPAASHIRSLLKSSEPEPGKS